MDSPVFSAFIFFLHSSPVSLRNYEVPGSTARIRRGWETNYMTDSRPEPEDSQHQILERCCGETKGCLVGELTIRLSRCLQLGLLEDTRHNCALKYPINICKLTTEDSLFLHIDMILVFERSPSQLSGDKILKCFYLV